MTKRIAAGTVTAALLVLSAAGTAAADTTTAPGPGACFGPPGQTGLVPTAKSIGLPPGQIVSFCNDHGHGQNQSSGGGVAT